MSNRIFVQAEIYGARRKKLHSFIVFEDSNFSRAVEPLMDSHKILDFSPVIKFKTPAGTPA